jgi:ligand-binding sensor domain-containing protein
MKWLNISLMVGSWLVVGSAALPEIALKVLPPTTSGEDIALPLVSQRLVPDDRVPTLCPDRSGDVWMGNWRGNVARVDPETGQIRTQVLLSGELVNEIAQDAAGNVWIGSANGLFRLNSSNQITKTDFELPSNQVRSLLIDTRGLLWVGTDRGLALINPLQGQMVTTLKSLTGSSADVMALDLQGFLWVGTPEGLAQVNTGTAVEQRVVAAIPGGSIQTISLGIQGNLWVGTQAGLFVVNPESGAVTRSVQALENQDVRAVAFDQKLSGWAQPMVCTRSIPTMERFLGKYAGCRARPRSGAYTRPWQQSLGRY